MDVMRFKAAVVDSDIASIAKISGLGKKTAERIVLELKDKLGVAAAWEAASADKAPSPEARAANDAVLALIALGYKQVDAAKSVREVALKNKDAGTEELVRLALKGLV
jgi:Holliday junction DNA helicase RuvA